MACEPRLSPPNPPTRRSLRAGRSRHWRRRPPAAARVADRIYLAPDPDREGEAIAWHLAGALKNVRRPIQRLTFNEITERAVKQAIDSPRDLDMNLVNAQQARRVLDRLVGYKVSPFVWRTVR